MTKKERLRLNTIHVIEMVQKNFDVFEDFNDNEGRGYFTFGVMKDGIGYLFDMHRNDFSIITHKIRGEKGFEIGRALEDELEVFIQNELKVSNIHINNLLK
jgi:hypothetical protein